MEEHTAEQMMNTFYGAVGAAITAHGLGLIGLFGIAIQEIALASGDEGTRGKRMSILATLVLTCVFYIVILIYIFVGLPNLSAEGDGEFTEDLDFGLHDGATCYDENPWMSDFEETLQNTGLGIMAILIAANVIVIIPSAVAYAPSAKTSPSY